MPTYASLFIPGRSARPNYTDCIYLYRTWVVTCPTTRSVCTWYVLGLYLGCHVIHLHVNTPPQVVLRIALNTCSVDQTIHPLPLEDKTQVPTLLDGARSLVDRDSL